MENDILVTGGGTTNACLASDSATDHKPQRCEQEIVATSTVQCDNHGSSIDIQPGSSKNVCQPMKSTLEQDTITDRLPWFVESVSLHSVDSVVCRICHSSESPQKLVSPCLCKGSLTYVHIHCLERWISMSRCTTCELCQFQYNTEQTLRYSMIESLRIWYARTMSRRALQEDCQMFSLLTLVAFGIIGTLMVAVQYYILQGHLSGLGRLWTKGWLIFFLFTTLVVYCINVYMIVKSQLTPWYRWWQSARDIHLILENQQPFQCDPGRAPIQSQPNQYERLAKPPPQPTVERPMVAGAKSLSGQLDNDALCTNSMLHTPPQDASGYTINCTTATSTIVALAAAAAVDTAVASRVAKTTFVLDLPISASANHIPPVASSDSSSKCNDDDAHDYNDDDDVSNTST